MIAAERAIHLLLIRQPGGRAEPTLGRRRQRLLRAAEKAPKLPTGRRPCIC